MSKWTGLTMLDFPAEALKATKLKEIRLEQTVNFIVSIGAGK